MTINNPTKTETNYYDKFCVLSDTVLKLREGRISERHIDNIISQLNEMAFYVNELQLEVIQKSSELNFYKQAIEDLTTGVGTHKFVDIK